MANYKAVDADQLDAGLEAIADAIREKSGTSDKLSFPTAMVAAIAAIQVGNGDTGGTTAKSKDVNFIDCDGTILYSYTLEEVQALTELPILPSHDGLVCQCWNWTLDAIKALGRAMTVGASYITDDGATRLHIRIATIGRMTVPLYFGQTAENGVSIDWGDGSAAETLAGTGYVNTSHTYAQPGDYVISLLPQDGCTLSLGSGGGTYCVLGSTANAGHVYANMLQTAHIGKNVISIDNYAFSYCRSLASATIPDSVTSIGAAAFFTCYSLASITIPDSVISIRGSAFASCYSLAIISIPDGVTSIGDSAFASCHSLAIISIPDGVTSIGASAFFGCRSLASATIPNSVTSIGASAFGGCYGMRYYDFTACTSVPTLSDVSAFSDIPSDCQMLIPAALYDGWSTATNWATYASYMVAV